MAWHPLGWRPAFFSEIDPAPRAVLAHHYPHIPLHGDFTTIGADDYGAIDLLVGGTPCQSFSLAGLRGGMADGRGNLALEYIRLAHRKRPRWMVWENVLGVFSSNGGEDFRSFLSGLVRWDVPLPVGGWQNSGIIAAGPADGAYGVAWRVLNAQYFGVPQHRRRVFLVGYIGDWRLAAAVLLERSSLSGISTPPVRNTIKDADWWAGKGRVLNCIDASYGRKWGSNQWYARGHVIVTPDGRPRRATPREVERCFGFPDDFTLIPFNGRAMPDDARYKMLGNSKVVPVVRWIGSRIQAVEEIVASLGARRAA